MNRPLLITAVVALVVGALVGFLWWGLPAQRAQTELENARARAERLERELGEVQGKLKTEQSRLEAAEQDLSREKEMNRRLQMLVSQGKK